MTAKLPAIFLDRDNTLNRDDAGYTWRQADFAWVEGAAESLALFQKIGLRVFVVTNQGGIGKGLYRTEDMHAFNTLLCEKAEQSGGFITDIAFCAHHPDADDMSMRGPCDWRKPGPGMLLALAQKWQIDLPGSVMVGDRESDVAAGMAAGCHAYLFEGGSLLPLAQRIINRHFSALSINTSWKDTSYEVDDV